ncbi:flavodoxin [Leuconostoc mesenteroides]|uniref:flavodoxin n=1 Tax=Leuconostoc mesenteroides TaxID=1245 RepID=UPI002954896E|nr:flavodoxin [Leuconostoc mesenteroides]MDV7738570.1 flavodoxin [Leuconostoc mesenteroides]
MKVRITIFGVVVIALVVAIFTFNSRNQRNQSTPTTSTQQKSSTSVKSANSGQTLIVYFSRREAASSIYKDKPLPVGNTKRIADMIAKKTGGTEYEIVPVKSYPRDFKTTSEVAQRELDDNARPKIKNPLPDVSDYNTVFVGAPVWWGDYPMVVHTFLDAVDLNGKNVVPFATSEGSGLGNFDSVLTNQYPNAKVLEGHFERGKDVADRRSSVESNVNRWLNGLGY